MKMNSNRAFSTILPVIAALPIFLSSAYAATAAGANGAGLDQYRKYALEHDGDAAQGKVLFNDPQKLACSKCHSVDGHGSKAGPDLFSVGDQFARRDIIEAILQPSASIAVGYSTTTLELNSGEAVSGILKESSDSEMELATADGQRVRVATKEIKSQKGSTVSLMPEGLALGISTREFCDLVQYLVTLKEESKAASTVRGMPESIPQLTPLLSLRPLLEKPLQYQPSAEELRNGVQTGLVTFAQMPGVTNDFLAADQSGMIWRIEKKSGGMESSVFADLTREVFSARGPNGLLGLAFHPQFKTNHKYYLKHQVMEAGKIATVIVEKTASSDYATDSREGSRRILKIDSGAEHHNGGCIQFGPDGFLYIGMGDSAPNHDPQGHGQDPRLLLGKMLRIDVDKSDREQPYAIPSGNPFQAGGGIRPEIWALGFREPWRFGFDRLTGDLWVADLGQERGDEVEIVRAGENFGWNVFEGFDLFSKQYRSESAHYIAPIFSTHRRDGSAVVGGFVYRGNLNSPFYGCYIFGDHVSKRIWALQQENRSLKSIRQIATSPESITAFAMDEAGEIYVVGYQGMIYELDLNQRGLHATKNLSASK